MREKLIGIIKNNRILYIIYYYTMTFFLKVLALATRRTNQILFVCYGGRKYGDNVKPIYEMMLNDNRYNNYKFIWAFVNPDKFSLPDSARTRKVKIDSLSYYVSALCAKCWVTNVSVQRGLNFKLRGILYCNTWHGVPLKLIGNDAKDEHTFRPMKREDYDLFFSEGIFDAQIFMKAFHVDKTRMCITGSPRNDVMFDQDKIDKMKEEVIGKYNIPENKRVILYAPTYRDYNRDFMGRFTFEVSFSFENFDKVFQNEYVLLVRSHGAIDIPIPSSNCVIDVSDYPNVEDLLVAADILITDYSGILFDFALLGKPILCYFYDLDKYKYSRGLYVNVETFFPFRISYTEKELFEHIASIDYENESLLSLQFVKKCGLINKGATKNVVNKIAEYLFAMDD